MRRNNVNWKNFFELKKRLKYGNTFQDVFSSYSDNGQKSFESKGLLGHGVGEVLWADIKAYTLNRIFKEAGSRLNF